MFCLSTNMSAHATSPLLISSLTHPGWTSVYIYILFPFHPQGLMSLQIPAEKIKSTCYSIIKKNCTQHLSNTNTSWTRVMHNLLRPGLSRLKTSSFSSTFIIHIHQAAILQQIKIGLIDLTAQDSFHSLAIQIQLDLIALPDAGRIGQPVGLIVNED